ncbi:GmrSD restriction endonuclease domain-containing protein [Aggregatibacter segnis]|uniref:GmrSD restriction endonuclease domain-containing protein n=1 Tax=Aggregatibacter segnis TaxID=739 RepID=UPI003FA0381B
MNNVKEYVKTLTISDLFNDKNKFNYIIPIYQRNYAWGNDEISSLLQDIKNACEKNKKQDKNYYIGSLVVYRRENGDFEVIDGQQRLTTLTLIMHYLGELSFRNVSFEHRDESEQALSNLNSKKLPSNFSQALETIKKVIDEWGNNKDEIVKFLLDKVEIIRTEVPEGTDLNHYFEIMNTRGEQLEKHEILKARLMEKLSEGIEQSLFAKIWDACSDMSRYAVMGFDSELREVIFGNDWQKTPRVFRMEILRVADELNRGKGKKEEDGKNGEKIVDLLNSKKKIELKDGHLEDKYDGAFTSVIDFPNFLMHVLRIYLEGSYDSRFQNVPLDEKDLLNDFGDQWNKEKVIKFIDVLLSCRYLFDKYVIKSSTLRSEDEHWSLWCVFKGNSSNYYYKNTFGSDKSESNDTDANEQTKNAIMLLSMFHVSNPSRIYKNWLYAVLRWLFKNKDNITFDSYVDFLKELCDKFYFGNNCQGKDITEIILDKVEVEFEFNLGSKESSEYKKYWDRGVNVPNFVFNRLDYQLWKLPGEKVKDFLRNDGWLTENTKNAIWKKFRFTFRSSVEHHYPQHPIDGQRIEDVDMFGNLYLLSQSKNSRLNNLTPIAKRDIIKPWNNCDSLKQVIMMSHDKWGEDEIKVHGEKMLTILNQPLSKTDS